ncbi:Uncharacterised protein [Bartonella elizabethae]|nr:Uncharacterised protein [Bartonella elizabethae]
MRVRRVSLEGKDALFLRAECILYEIGYMSHEGPWRVSVEGKDALFEGGVHPL